MKQYVLDACALLSLLLNENGQEKVSSILGEAINGKAVVCMHGANLLEVYYDRYKVLGKEQAEEMMRQIKQLPISMRMNISDGLFAEAGRLKATYRISLGDAFALSLASICGGTLLTCDHHEFDAVDKTEKIKFLWIR